MKKLLTLLLSMFLLLSSTITVFAEDTAIITIDLNGGSEAANGIPNGWTKLEEGKYSKDYPLNESVNLTEEWSDYKPTKTDCEFSRWQDDNYVYWDGFSISEDITVKATYKAYLYVIMDLKGGTIPNGSAPSGWEKVPDHDDQYRKKFLQGTYYWDVTSEWENVIPQYSTESGVGFAGWKDPDWFDLQDDNSVIEAKTDDLLNVIFDLKGGTFSAENVPSGWTKDASLDDHYIKKYVKGTSYYWTIKNELDNIVPQYSVESGVGFAGWKDPEWYNLETDNSVIEAKTGALKTVTVDFNGGTLLSTNSTWTQDLTETDKYTKKFPVGYSTSNIYDEITSSFSIKSFDGNKFFTGSFVYDYSIWEVPEDDDIVFTATYEDAISLTINIPDNGIIIVNDEQKNSTVTLDMPRNASVLCNDGVLSIVSNSPNISYKIEAYGNSGYELDYFAYNGTKIDSSISTLSDGDYFSAVMKEGLQKYPVWIDGVQFSEGNTSLLNGSAVYNPSTRVLTLDGANIVFSSSSGISFTTSITVNVISDSSITAVESGNSKYAIAGMNPDDCTGSPSSSSNLIITGNGKLTIDLKKSDVSSPTINIGGIIANKIDISTDIEIISDKVHNSAYYDANFYGIESNSTGGTTIKNGKTVTVYVKSVSSLMGMSKCNLIGGPLTIDNNSFVDLSIGSISSTNNPVFSSGTNLLAGTISISSNPAGDIDLLQATELKTIDGATAGATTTDTSFTQANTSSPLILSTKTLVLVEGISMNKEEFKSTEAVGYTGTKSAKKKADSTVVTDQIDTWNYIYYKESEAGSNVWSKLSAAPTVEGSYKLVVEAQDSEYFGKLELPFTVVHGHTFIYAVNSENTAQLTATCSGTDCEYNDTPFSLTLISPSLNELVYDGSAKEISFADGEKEVWEEKIENTAPTIEYYLEDGTTKTNSTNSGASSEGFAPKNVGTYKAKATVDTNKTAVLEFSITPKEYAIESISNSEWKTGSSENLVITSDAPLSEFDCVKVDGAEIDDAYYSVENGSTKVTIYKTYLDTLSIGSHTFEIISQNGSASTTISIANNGGGNNNTSHSYYTVPNTGIN